MRLVPTRSRNSRSLLFASFLGAIVTSLAGLLLLGPPDARRSGDTSTRPVPNWMLGSLRDAVLRTSYDSLFLMRGALPAEGACIVYFDEGSARALGQRADLWDRSLHTRLVRRLTELGARAIFFDIVFSEPSPLPTVDEEFAAAIADHGTVFLGAALELDEGAGAFQQRTLAPTATLRRAAAAWGLIAFRPVDSDYSVRRMYGGMDTVPSLSWLAARKLGAPLEEEDRPLLSDRWLNYYGPSDSFPNISYERVLDPSGVPSDFFRDRIVMVGGRSTLGTLKLGKDDFRNPYSLIGAPFFKGPELHLTALLNLVRQDSLGRLDHRWEAIFIVVVGSLLGAGLPWLRPHAIGVITVATILAVIALAGWLFHAHHVWSVWMIPALVQAPLGLAWGISTRYFVEEKRRLALRNAFALYLSPRMADRIADADFDLSLGGKMVEATVLFTDIENFMGLSEELAEPEKVAKFLTDYFTLTTGHILDSDGTIVKYLGDSVQAVWGAPLPDENHARKAARAALALQQSGKMEVLDRPLRTRIGINTGPMLSGNLGSAQRFDYAVTGDAVNFASRLEGINKFLGTTLLVAETVVAQMGDGFLARCVGEFLVIGKREPRVVYELLAEGTEAPPWMEFFARGLAAYRAGNLDAAERAFRETIDQRGEDGPSTFYLKHIAAARAEGVGEGWTGIITLHAK